MIENWEFWLLDRDDQPLHLLDGVNGGRMEVVARDTLGGSGSISIDERGQGIDWMSHRIQAVYNNGVESWAAGTFLFTSPTDQHSSTTLTYDGGLLTKMNNPNSDRVDDRYSIDAGVPVIPAVVTLLQSTGETRIAVTDSDAVLSAPLTWEPGTTKLTIINDLLTAVGYWSLWCDGSGQFRVEPYVRPQDRPVLYEFEHGPRSVHYADWSREQDASDVPNKVILTTRGDDETEGMVGIATNENPDSPYSFQERGQWLPAEPETVEAASQQVLDDMAARRLLDLMSPVARVTVGHAFMDLPPDGLVAFTPEDGVRRLLTIQRMTIPFEPFPDVKAEWRELL